MRYAMMIFGVEEEWSAQEAAGAMKQIDEWFTRWSEAGKIAQGGAELDTVRKAKTLRSGPDGPVVTDGPYLELKEVIGGVLFLEAEDIDEAVAIASGWPLAGSSSVEIRPVINR
jgi:hypothetical protein